MQTGKRSILVISVKPSVLSCLVTYTKKYITVQIILRSNRQDGTETNPILNSVFNLSPLTETIFTAMNKPDKGTMLDIKTKNSLSWPCTINIAFVYNKPPTENTQSRKQYLTSPCYLPLGWSGRGGNPCGGASRNSALSWTCSLTPWQSPSHPLLTLSKIKTCMQTRKGNAMYAVRWTRRKWCE